MENRVSKYKKMFVKLKEKNGDNEAAHFIQDDIYRKFIKDIASGKFEMKEDIVLLAKEIKKNVIVYDNTQNRWYA